MPYFWWQGTTVTGTVLSGYLYAPSQLFLDSYLFKNHIALIKTKDYSWMLFLYKISLQDKADFFEQLATLLHNGIQLPPACTIIAQQSENPKIQQAVFGCLASIEGGTSITQSMSLWPDLFDSFGCQTITVGSQTGTLSIVCQLLARYYQAEVHFKKKIQTALLTPLVTLFALVAVFILLSIFFIPQLASMFKSLNLEIPASTQRLISVSEYLQSHYSLIYISIFFAAFYFLYMYLKKSISFKKKIETICFKTPFVRLLCITHAQATYFSFLSLLLQAHIQLPQALAIIAQVVELGRLHDASVAIADAVHAGTPFYAAMSAHPFLFEPHQVATIAVAQETDSLAPAAVRLSEQTQKRIDGLYRKIIFWLGPLLLLLLGFGVTILIVAVYSPLLNLSFAIH